MNKWRMRVGRLFGRDLQDHCVGREDNGRHYVEMREVGLHIYMCEIDISWPVAVRQPADWESLTSLVPAVPSPQGLQLQTGLGRALLQRVIIDTLRVSTVGLSYKVKYSISILENIYEKTNDWLMTVVEMPLILELFTKYTAKSCFPNNEF